MSATDAIPLWVPPPGPAPELHTVDSDDEIEFVRHGRSSPEITVLSHRRPQRTLYIDDDDDEIVILHDDAAAPAPRAGPSNHRRIFSPPPPPQHPAIVPPVPPLPDDFWPHHAYPRRPVARPAIYANPGPMGWEAGRDYVPFAELQRREPERDAFPRAAPPSHHVPAMGLGGALLATNRPPAAGPAAARYQRAAGRHAHLHLAPDEEPVPDRHIRHVARPQQTWGGHFLEAGGHILRAMRHVAGFPPLGPAAEAALLVEVQLGERLFGHAHAPHPPLHPREPDYKPEYTHSAAPAPGFAFDFAPPVIEPGEKAAAPIVIDDEPAVVREPVPEATLVCAACRAPLLMEGGRATDEETRRRERVWALRCGHMFDGRCVDVMMKPPPDPEPEPELEVESTDMKVELDEPLADKKGKGKAKAEPFNASADPEAQDKAKDEPEEPMDELLLKDGDYSDASKPPPPAEDEPKSTTRKPSKRKPGDTFEGIKLDAIVDHAVASSIRSRLRRRPGASDVPEDAPAPPPPPPRVRKTKAMPKRKAKGKGRPQQAERFEWKCPIAACTRVHVSVRLEGEWVHDAKQGAIALFV